MKISILTLLIIDLIYNSYVFSIVTRKVLVTGAAGRTSLLIFQKLLKIPTIELTGLVKSNSSINKLKQIGALEPQIKVGDITDIASLERAFESVDTVILGTSAVPKIKILSIAKTIVFKLISSVFKNVTVPRPEFYFSNLGDPYFVDWLGAKNQIDLAKRFGVRHFIFVSSMGGTQPDNFLNTIGKVEGDDKSGNILLWKRKAEKYLIESGVPYTIIHPGGLVDKKGGEREVVFGNNDELLKESNRVIPREDVAEVAVQALFQPAAINRSFDVITRPPGEGVVTEDWSKFFKQIGDNSY